MSTFDVVCMTGFFIELAVIDVIELKSVNS